MSLEYRPSTFRDRVRSFAQKTLTFLKYAIIAIVALFGIFCFFTAGANILTLGYWVPGEDDDEVDLFAETTAEDITDYVAKYASYDYRDESIWVDDYVVEDIKGKLEDAFKERTSHIRWNAFFGSVPVVFIILYLVRRDMKNRASSSRMYDSSKLHRLISDKAFEFAKFDEEIIGKICRRAIKQMNETLDSIFLEGDFPKNFTFFDRLSVLYQSRTFDEMGYGTELEGRIEDILYDEIGNLSPMERTILLNSKLKDDLRTDLQTIQMKIFNHFKELLNKHIYKQKIMNFMEHNNYLLCGKG